MQRGIRAVAAMLEHLSKSDLKPNNKNSRVLNPRVCIWVDDELKIRLNCQMRAELAQIREFNGNLRSSIRHSLPLLRVNERGTIMRSGNGDSELVLLSSGNEPGERQPASGVVSESIDMTVADSILAE